MKKFKHFIKNYLSYYIIVAISLMSLYVYLENMPMVRQKKIDTIAAVGNTIRGIQPSITPEENQVVAGAATQNIETITTYNIEKGDNLWKIAEKFYGDGSKAFELAKANNIPNPDIIYAGSQLTIRL